jgi:large-conductance mechanosensitive channel
MDTINHPLPSIGFYIKLTLLSWLSMIGFDFFLHAGLLSRIYLQPSPFLLPLDRAFAYIPIGYASFLIFGIFLLWLMLKLKIQGWKQGTIFGLQVGVLIWGAFSMGLFSIATAPPNLLVAWFLGQATELGIAGGVIGYGLTQSSFGRLLKSVLIFVIVSIVIAIVLQNISFAQAPSIKNGN